MKPLIKQLLRESLLKEENLEEGYFKSFLVALLMTYGLSWGQIKPEYKAKIDSIQKLENLSKQEKREEVEKIVKINRDEISGKKRQDFLRTMAAAGYTDEKKYLQYLAKNAKKKDVGQDGLIDCSKRTKKTGSCTTGNTGGGQSTDDID
jgi:hypothetical protein